MTNTSVSKKSKYCQSNHTNEECSMQKDVNEEMLQAKRNY